MARGWRGLQECGVHSVRVANPAVHNTGVPSVTCGLALPSGERLLIESETVPASISLNTRSS